MSPAVPLLLIEDPQGNDYTGQSGGVCCNHPGATGFIFNIYGATELGQYLDGSHHDRWCCYIDEDGLEALDHYFSLHNIPIRTTSGWNDEGWVSVMIMDTLPHSWAYLQSYAGRSAVLVWNNCD